METPVIPDYERDLSFEQIWASIKELRESQKETGRLFRENAEREKEMIERQFEYLERQRENAERQRKEEAERQREDDKRRQEDLEQQRKKDAAWKEEFNRMIRQSNKQMGELHNRFGQLAEHLVAPSINKRFNELGYHFGSFSPGGHKIEDEKGKTKAEIDILLENGETIMAVEVKIKPAVKDVEAHLKRLEVLKEHRRGINDKRTIKGAIAGAIFGAVEKKATADAGLYVVEQSGDTMRIDVPEGFVPREW